MFSVLRRRENLVYLLISRFRCLIEWLVLLCYMVPKYMYMGYCSMIESIFLQFYKKIILHFK